MDLIGDREKEMFRTILLQEMAALLKRLDHNESFDFKKSYPHDSVGELSSYDNHPADVGTELFEREKNYALFVHEQRQLKNIQQALAAIDQGSYGKCEVCGKRIPFERLKALPTTTRCKEHSDEKIIEGRGEHEPDHRFEETSFDIEYAWQEVAQWGTSDSPTDDFKKNYSDTQFEPEENYGFVEDYENMYGIDLFGNHYIFIGN